MTCAQRIVVAESRHPGLPISVTTPGWRRLALLVSGAMAFLATACGASGSSTHCSSYMSMDSADQRSTITTMLQQDGFSNPSADDVSSEQTSKSEYCSIAGLYGTTIGDPVDSGAP
jgi:hypothetical protein